MCICNELDSQERLWVATVDLDVTYMVADSMEELCQEVYEGWPQGEIDDYELLSDIPVVVYPYSTHSHFHIFKTRSLAQEFLWTIADVISSQD